MLSCSSSPSTSNFKVHWLVSTKPASRAEISEMCCSHKLHVKIYLFFFFKRRGGNGGGLIKETEYFPR